MSFVFWLLILLHVIGCFGLILLVLVQNDKAGGLSSAFGGAGSSQAFSSAGAATFVSKLTKWWAVGLFVVIFSINLIVSRAHFGRETGSAVQQALQEDGAAKVLREMGAPEGPQAPAGIPGVPVSPVPGVPQTPAAP
ncbi:MAG: preprotein translocase subunit SecG [Fibrobacteria bacterium]|nr:preprotein translocase subunit SecG [Fibrobacteria bacterium]